MHYKTIMLELLESHPVLHQRLRASGILPQTLDQYALALKESHVFWTSNLKTIYPRSDSSHLSSEALEIALQEIQNGLLLTSLPQETNPLTLDAAMAFIRRHMPHE